VGDENDGWRVTMVTLSFERGTGFVGELLESMRVLRSLTELAKRTGQWGDPSVRRRVGTLTGAFDALWALTKRNVSEAARNGVPGVGGVVFKLAYSEQGQALTELGMDLLDRAGLAMSGLDGADGLGELPNHELVDSWIKSISLTIAAGTSQVQRNIVAERLLGLPKEIR
ncbi:MAG: acyl-CoA dehydrogenase family protein, partial [Actinomycetes bacterium]